MRVLLLPSMDLAQITLKYVRNNWLQGDYIIYSLYYSTWKLKKGVFVSHLGIQNLGATIIIMS